MGSDVLVSKGILLVIAVALATLGAKITFVTGPVSEAKETLCFSQTESKERKAVI